MVLEGLGIIPELQGAFFQEVLLDLFKMGNLASEKWFSCPKEMRIQFQVYPTLHDGFLY